MARGKAKSKKAGMQSKTQGSSGKARGSKQPHNQKESQPKAKAFSMGTTAPKARTTTKQRKIMKTNRMGKVAKRGRINIMSDAVKMEMKLDEEDEDPGLNAIHWPDDREVPFDW